MSCRVEACYVTISCGELLIFGLLAVCDTLLTIAFTVALDAKNIPEADTRTFRRLLAKVAAPESLCSLALMRIPNLRQPWTRARTIRTRRDWVW